MWTNEVAKLQNKACQDEDVAAEPFSTRKAKSSDLVKEDHESLSLFQRYGGLATNYLGNQLNKLLNYSDASVSMIVDCVSP